MVSSAFNINNIPETQRFDCWHDVICQTYLTVDCQRLTDGPLEGFIQARELGSLWFSEVTSPAMTYQRGKAELNRSHEEYFQLVLVVDGSGVVEQGDNQALINPGDMVVYSSTEPSRVSYPNGSNTQVVKIPRPLLADRIEAIDQIAATLLNGSSPIGVMTRNLIRECINVSLDNHCSSTRFSNGILDILATAIENNLPIDASARASSVPLLNVKRYIEERLADPDLDVAQIAQHNNVSVRTLNRMFAADGTTATRWLWNRRLANSHKVLSEGKVKQVSQAAFEFGFNDLSHFSKAFKKRYGVAPHEILRNTR